MSKGKNQKTSKEVLEVLEVIVNKRSNRDRVCSKEIVSEKGGETTIAQFEMTPKRPGSENEDNKE